MARQAYQEQLLKLNGELIEMVTSARRRCRW